MSGFADPMIFGVAQPGFATAGYQVDVVGHMLVRGRGDFQLQTAGDTAPFVRLVGNGVNSATTELYTGDRDPNGVASAVPGSLYLRQSGASSNLYANALGPTAGAAGRPIRSDNRRGGRKPWPSTSTS